MNDNASLMLVENGEASSSIVVSPDIQDVSEGETFGAFCRDRICPGGCHRRVVGRKGFRGGSSALKQNGIDCHAGGVRPREDIDASECLYWPGIYEP